MDSGKNLHNFQQKHGYTAEEWAACLKVLRSLKDDPFNNPDNEHLSGLLTKVYKKATKEIRRASRQGNKARAIEVINRSKLAQNARYQTSFYGREEENHQQTYTQVEQPRNCYICNRPYHEIHSFYHRLCPTCAEGNFQWRNRTTNLINRF